jgi:hypothetical protein
MEFQAVFFVDIDNLAVADTALVDKYIYVGLSRASFFLAFTVESGFPERLKILEGSFVEGEWKK